MRPTEKEEEEEERFVFLSIYLGARSCNRGPSCIVCSLPAPCPEFSSSQNLQPQNLHLHEPQPHNPHPHNPQPYNPHPHNPHPPASLRVKTTRKLHPIPGIPQLSFNVTNPQIHGRKQTLWRVYFSMWVEMDTEMDFKIYEFRPRTIRVIASKRTEKNVRLCLMEWYRWFGVVCHGQNYG